MKGQEKLEIITKKKSEFIHYKRMDFTHEISSLDMASARALKFPIFSKSSILQIPELLNTNDPKRNEVFMR